jgi:hypothetical protein
MNFTWPTWLSHNPVAWVALLNGVVAAVIVFGVPITDPEKLAIGAVLGLISTLFVQSQVTSTAKLTSLGVTIQPATTTQVVVLTPPAVPAPPTPTPSPAGTDALAPVNPQVPPVGGTP